MKIPFFNKDNESIKEEIIEVEIAKIAVNPFQPRQEFKEEEINELAASIENFGLLQAITIRPAAENYELVAGERRLRAAKKIGKKTIPAVIKNFNDQEMAEIALIENLQRKDLNFIEEAVAYQKLLDQYDLTQKQLALRLSKSQSTIANKLRLLKLELPVREKLTKNNLSERHGRALLKINSAAEQLEVITEIAEKDLTVRQSEQLIDKLINPLKENKKKKIRHISADLRLYANSLEKRIAEIKDSGVEVELDRNDKDNYIEYYIKLSK